MATDTQGTKILPSPSLKPGANDIKARPPAAGTPRLSEPRPPPPPARQPRPPPWTPCPLSPARPGEREGRRGRQPPPPPGRRDAHTPTRRPHLRRGRTASGRRAWRARESYSPGEPGSRASAERRLRFAAPLRGRGASGPPAPPGPAAAAAAAAADFLAKRSKL